MADLIISNYDLKQERSSLINVGILPETAHDIYDYVKDALLVRATPLKLISLELHSMAVSLPEQWEEWTEDEVAAASELYNDIHEHIKNVSYKTKPTELDSISEKADKLHKGIVAAIKDVLGDVPTDKDSLAKKIRAWRGREEERAKEEERRLAELAAKQEEERRLQEALELEKEAERLKAQGHEGLAEEVKQEAETVLTEPISHIPPPIVQANIPKGGPSKRKYTKIEVTNLMVLVRAVAAGTVPIQALKADESFIRNQAERLKLSFNYPGVKWWEE